MPAHLIFKGPEWTVAAYVAGGGECEFFELLSSPDFQGTATHTKIMRILRQAAEAGPQVHNKAICKKFKGDHADDIYEFKANELRVLWFYSPKVRKLILCTHSFIKDDDKTPPGEITKAQRLRRSHEAES